MQHAVSKTAHIVLSGFLLGAMFWGGAYAAKLHYADKTPPHLYLASTLNIGGLSEQELREMIEKRAAHFANTPFEFEYNGSTIRILPSAFGLRIPKEELMSQAIYVGADAGLGTFIKQIFSPKEITFDTYLDPQKIEQNLRTFIPELTEPEDARLIIDENREIALAHGYPGVEIDMDEMLRELKTSMWRMDPGRIQIKTNLKIPAVSRTYIEPHFVTINERLNQKLTLKKDKHTWEINFKEYIAQNAIHFEKDSELAGLNPSTRPQLVFEKSAVENILKKDILPKIYKPPHDVTVSRDEKGKISFEGYGENGETADTVRLVDAINNALNGNEIKEINVPIKRLAGKVNTSQELQKLGIRDVLGVGHTTYYHSPLNRRYNIKLGVEQFNGVLIGPGETISFNEILGPVVARRGFLEELVIKKGNELEKEIGGGLCQVSTTLYRAGLRAGLPIVERRAHSFPVLYYSQIDGHGLDATVYPPSQDLKMVNDTPGHLLIQAYTYSQEAKIHIYGTFDNRSVELEGPYILSGNVYNGLETKWYRHITKNGKTEKELIYSKYGAIPVEKEEDEKTPDDS